MSAKTHTITTKNGSTIELSVLEGTVISAGSHTKWTTHHEGATVVGKTVVPGQVYNVAHNIEDIWIQRDDGKEQKLPFPSALVDLRPGHEVLFLHSKDTDGDQRCVAAWNKTTDQVRTGPKAVRDVFGANSKTSWFGSLMFWGSIAMAASPLFFITNGDQRNVVGFLLFGVVVFNIVVAINLNQAAIKGFHEQAKQLLSDIQARHAA